MSEYILTPSEMKLWERDYITKGMSSLVLMENAAGNAAREIMRREEPQKAFVFCGPGNNGGDGFAISRHLKNHGFEPVIILLCSKEKFSGDALLNLKMAELVRTKVLNFGEDSMPDLKDGFIVDAIFGTGLSRNAEGLYSEAISLINNSGLRVYSVDIPSGINEKGRIMGCAVRADVTISFQYIKTSHLLFPGREFAGELVLKDIGLPKDFFSEIPKLLSEESDIPASLKERQLNTHKGDYGRLAIIAGSEELAGAGAMSAKAALRTGCGLLTIGSGESLCPLYHSMLPEAMTKAFPEYNGKIAAGCSSLAEEFLSNKTAAVIGPGLGRAPGLRELLKAVIGKKPAVLDADAINVLSENMELFKASDGNLILTPHPGEMARLCGKSTEEIIADPMEAASDFAAKYNAILILKGATTITALPNGSLFFNISGNPGLAKGGSGDVLSGILGALLSRGLAPEDAARFGPLIFGLAADRALAHKSLNSLLASDVIEALSGVI